MVKQDRIRMCKESVKIAYVYFSLAIYIFFFFASKKN